MKFILALSAVLLVNAAALAQTACKTAPTPIRLAAGTLDKALAGLSTQVGCPVQYDKIRTRKFHSRAVQGTLTPIAALAQLVRGTGLEAHSNSEGLVVSEVDQNTTVLKAATLQSKLTKAIESKKIDEPTGQAMYKELAEVRTSVTTLVKQQGFVSAGETASYERTFAKAEQLLTKRK